MKTKKPNLNINKEKHASKAQIYHNIKIHKTHKKLTQVWSAPTTSSLETERVYSGKARDRQRKQTGKASRHTNNNTCKHTYIAPKSTSESWAHLTYGALTGTVPNDNLYFVYPLNTQLLLAVK